MASSKQEARMLGLVIRLNRMRHKLSLVDLAKATGIPWMDIMAVEEGETTSSAQEWLIRIALAFGSTAEELRTEMELLKENEKFAVLLESAGPSDDEVLAWLNEYDLELARDAEV